MTCSRGLFAALAGTAVALAASSASAAGVVVPFDVTGIASMDGFFLPPGTDADNVVVLVDIAAALGLPSGTAVSMNGFGFDVTLFADPSVGPFGGSWLTELRVAVSDQPLTDGFFIAPGTGAANEHPGTQAFSSGGIEKFTPGTELLLPNGILRLEFNEGFDDAAGVADGQWVSGFLNFQFVPTPGAAALMGLGGLVAARRRRA